ncbi:CHAT domain-containing protein [Nostoc sp. KVJ3]|uniref:CHAT domain-containing protein n=1 Tax=Nostoc sp. KVJ3 TaxID=457945 RepID=UPI002237173A|nr:CHAT domain-containing protein [Nostoc sp. KVJ3]MCW5312854.1 CHAT domain-containing protein [Nostoc sp. KVJ3]
MQKLSKKIITVILLALLGLFSAFTIPALTSSKVIGVQPQIGQHKNQELSCSATANISPEDLSLRGKYNYQIARFEDAIDCWKNAVTAYRKVNNEEEAVNNQINQALAEQEMGLYPRACNTLLQIYGIKDCILQVQDQEKYNQFKDKFTRPEAIISLLKSPARYAGLRILGNVFRGLGELDLSYKILVVLANNASVFPQQTEAVWLDLGNTIRTLSNREQDFYSRSQQVENLNCAFTYSNVADSIYQQIISYKDQLSNSSELTKLQAQLNRLSLVLDLISWSKEMSKETQAKDTVFQKFSNIYRSSFGRVRCDEWQLNLYKPNIVKNLNTETINNNLYDIVQQLAQGSWQIPSQQIDTLQQQIGQLPVTHATLFIRLNFAKSLIRIDAPNLKIEQFLTNTIQQAKNIGDLRAESYGYGYLGELSEKRQQWDLARENTKQALFLSQSLSIPSSPSDIDYLWEWQLGRIYKFQLPTRIQAQNKEMKTEGSQNFDNASQFYQKAYLTLQSLRRELVAGNPDAQFSFQDDIESVYRDYVELLLWDSNPEQKNRSKAREVISSLQAVELENFLRLSCPEFNLEKIDEIVDQQPVRTAFLYPILVNERIEVILKLPDNTNAKVKTTGKSTNKSISNLEHYSTQIDQPTVEKQIKDLNLQIEPDEYTFNALLRKLQTDLEEEYTFKDLKKEANLLYKWLVQGAEKYIKDQKIDTLVFALDTNLRNIPLAALVVDYDEKEEKTRYLIDDYALALAPRLEIPKPQAIKGKGLKILAAGLKEQEEEKGSVTNKIKYPKLNYVKKEIDAIEELPNSGFSVDKLINANFKIDEFKNEINTFAFTVIHLATHGEFSSNPEKTFLLASNGLININQIGNIFRKQAQRQPEPIELLVLSACETATGDKRATLGISGVGVRAGARSAVASLWTLDDEISVDFTERFYRKLIDPKIITKAQALQQAQKQLKDLPGREHPRYWASYILLGNWL